LKAAGSSAVRPLVPMIWFIAVFAITIAIGIGAATLIYKD
jgi:hypothetical protein